MPKPATPETAQGEHLKDYVLMKYAATGEVRRVPAKPEAIIPLMTNGWSQVFEEITEGGN